MGRDPDVRQDVRQVLVGDEISVRNIIDPLPSYVLLVDCDHRIIMANQALYTTYGLRREDVAGAYCPQLIHGLDGPFPGCPVEEACETGCGVEREIYDEEHGTWMVSSAYHTKMVTAEGKPVMLHLVADITDKKRAELELARLRLGLEETVALRTRELEVVNRRLQSEIHERKHAEETIRKLAYFDGLTGLPNRMNFSDLLAKAIQGVGRHGRRFAVALLDVDGLKAVNDSMGHDAGDRLLCMVGHRLTKTLRGDDTAARMGGDEFLFILNDLGDSADFGSIGQRLLDAFEQPFKVNGAELRVQASIGFAACPDDGFDEVTLLKKADVAMYEAKNAGGNRCRRFRGSVGSHG